MQKPSGSLPVAVLVQSDYSQKSHSAVISETHSVAPVFLGCCPKCHLLFLQALPSLLPALLPLALAPVAPQPPTPSEASLLPAPHPEIWSCASSLPIHFIPAVLPLHSSVPQLPSERLRSTASSICSPLK